MKDAIQEISQEYQKISKEHYLKGEYAIWHLNGLMYHADSMITQYSAIAEELLTRLNKLTFVHVFIMHTPQMQNLMYEFYAFISLARISLDNLKHIIYPLFKNPTNQMPKSVTDLGSGNTDCPIYERIANTEELQYLIDLRNCLVHYRTFAINNHSVIKYEGVDNFEKDSIEELTKPMAKGSFRITENNDVVFNIFLPDIIYNRENNNKKLVDFTYNNRMNILAETIRFIRHIVFNYMEAMAINIVSQEERFTFDKKGGISPVNYKTIYL
ncbi:hypothetical protein [Runella sp.]|uniref:hypothetical protein n=1 Tax=Runella sp. TaxID=1960881 RepID=UPI003D0CF30A